MQGGQGIAAVCGKAERRQAGIEIRLAAGQPVTTGLRFQQGGTGSSEAQAAADTGQVKNQHRAVGIGQGDSGQGCQAAVLDGHRVRQGEARCRRGAEIDDTGGVRGQYFLIAQGQGQFKGRIGDGGGKAQVGQTVTEIGQAATEAQTGGTASADRGGAAGAKVEQAAFRAGQFEGELRAVKVLDRNTGQGHGFADFEGLDTFGNRQLRSRYHLEGDVFTAVGGAAVTVIHADLQTGSRVFGFRLEFQIGQGGVEIGHGTGQLTDSTVQFTDHHAADRIHRQGAGGWRQGHLQRGAILGVVGIGQAYSDQFAGQTRHHGGLGGQQQAGRGDGFHGQHHAGIGGGRVTVGGGQGHAGGCAGIGLALVQQAGQGGVHRRQGAFHCQAFAVAADRGRAGQPDITVFDADRHRQQRAVGIFQLYSRLGSRLARQGTQACRGGEHRCAGVVVANQAIGTGNLKTGHPVRIGQGDRVGFIGFLQGVAADGQGQNLAGFAVGEADLPAGQGAAKIGGIHTAADAVIHRQGSPGIPVTGDEIGVGDRVCIAFEGLGDLPLDAQPDWHHDADVLGTGGTGQIIPGIQRDGFAQVDLVRTALQSLGHLILGQGLYLGDLDQAVQYCGVVGGHHGGQGVSDAAITGTDHRGCLFDHVVNPAGIDTGGGTGRIFDQVSDHGRIGQVSGGTTAGPGVKVGGQGTDNGRGGVAGSQGCRRRSLHHRRGLYQQVGHFGRLGLNLDGCGDGVSIAFGTGGGNQRVKLGQADTVRQVEDFLQVGFLYRQFGSTGPGTCQPHQQGGERIDDPGSGRCLVDVGKGQLGGDVLGTLAITDQDVGTTAAPQQVTAKFIGGGTGLACIKLAIVVGVGKYGGSLDVAVNGHPFHCIEPHRRQADRGVFRCDGIARRIAQAAAGQATVQPDAVDVDVVRGYRVAEAQGIGAIATRQGGRAHLFLIAAIGLAHAEGQVQAQSFPGGNRLVEGSVKFHPITAQIDVAQFAYHPGDAQQLRGRVVVLDDAQGSGSQQPVINRRSTVRPARHRDFVQLDTQAFRWLNLVVTAQVEGERLPGLTRRKLHLAVKGGCLGQIGGINTGIGFDAPAYRRSLTAVAAAGHGKLNRRGAAVALGDYRLVGTDIKVLHRLDHNANDPGLHVDTVGYAVANRSHLAVLSDRWCVLQTGQIVLADQVTGLDDCSVLLADRTLFRYGSNLNRQGIAFAVNRISDAETKAVARIRFAFAVLVDVDGFIGIQGWGRVLTGDRQAEGRFRRQTGAVTQGVAHRFNGLFAGFERGIGLTRFKAVGAVTVQGEQAAAAEGQGSANLSGIPVHGGDCQRITRIGVAVIGQDPGRSRAVECAALAGCQAVVDSFGRAVGHGGQFQAERLAGGGSVRIGSGEAEAEAAAGGVRRYAAADGQADRVEAEPCRQGTAVGQGELKAEGIAVRIAEGLGCQRAAEVTANLGGQFRKRTARQRCLVQVGDGQGVALQRGGGAVAQAECDRVAAGCSQVRGAAQGGGAVAIIGEAEPGWQGFCRQLQSGGRVTVTVADRVGIALGFADGFRRAAGEYRRGGGGQCQAERLAGDGSAWVGSGEAETEAAAGRVRRYAAADGQADRVEAEPCRQGTTLGQGQLKAEGIAVRIAEGIDRKVCAEVAADLGGQFRKRTARQRCLVLAGYPDNQASRCGQTGRIGHRVAEAVLQRFGLTPQGLYRRVVGINHVGITPSGLQGQKAVLAAGYLTYGTAIDAGHRQAVVCIDVLVVIQHIAFSPVTLAGCTADNLNAVVNGLRSLVEVSDGQGIALQRG